MTNKKIRILGKMLNITIRNDGDWAIAHELFLDHQYRQCDKAIKKATNAIIDIGGHLGFFSIYAALINPKVPIYAFEPHEGNYKLFKQNIKQNRIKNVHPKMLAVSNKIAQLNLEISAEDLNHSLTGALEPTGQHQKVQSITLERIMEKNRIKKCELVKIDCEGSEFDILYATPNDVFSKIENMFIEYHDWTPNQNHMELKSYLEKVGYKVQKFPNQRINELGFFWCHR